MRPRFQRPISPSMQAAFAFALCLGCCDQTLNAQVAPGARVRVRQETQCCVVTTTGKFVALTPTALLLRAPRSDTTIAVPRDNIREIEQAVPGSDHVYLGTTIGLLVGAGAGFDYGLHHPGCHGDGPCLAVIVGAGTAFVGGLVGMVAGSLIGSHIKRDEWQPVDLPARVGVLPTKHGLQISVSAGY